MIYKIYMIGFPVGSVVKNPPANAEDVGSILESGRSPGEGNGNPLQYSCLGNAMDRGACPILQYMGWQRVRLRTHTQIHIRLDIYKCLKIFQH